MFRISGNLQSGVSEKMTLAAGSKLGPYEILSTIGAGGMGEVYRARDTRLVLKKLIQLLTGSIKQWMKTLAWSSLAWSLHLFLMPCAPTPATKN
jgi:hypothetical protein